MEPCRIDDVVTRPSRDEHGEARADHCANTIENSLARAQELDHSQR